MYLSTGIVVEPKNLQSRQIDKISDLLDVCDVILPQIQFLHISPITCNFMHVEKSLRLEIRFTLSEMTSRLGILAIRDKSYRSLPHRFKFLMLCRLSDLVFVNTRSAVKGLPKFFVLILLFINIFEF